MRKLIYLVLSVNLLVCTLGFAQNNQLFEEATQAYNEGQYEKALDNYAKILSDGEHSAALYFNMGNAHYKLNHIAPSIYYYEKALLLDPTDKEIKTNLAFAQNMALDDIDPLPQTTLSKIYQNVVGYFSFDGWAVLAVIFMFVFVSGYIAYYFLKYSMHKRLAFIIGSTALVISLISVTLAYFEKARVSKKNPAIVFAEEAVIKSEPNNRSSETFRLHEGAKVNVLDSLDGWQKISIVDGKTGWILNEDIKLLKPL